MNKKRLKRIEENQRILNAKIDLLLKLCGASEVELKSIPGGGIKPPKTGDGG